VNVLWALLNLLVGYLLFRVGKISSGETLTLVIFFAGFALLSTLMSAQFQKKHAK
jgi:hypothetical protein